MHSKNYGTALFLILMIVGLTILPVNAHEVEVSYVPQDYELKTFHMEVRIQGEGAVLDQGLTLKNPTFFALHSDEKKQFVLQPAQGYEIADIQYDGEDITNLLQQQTLTVKGKDHDTKLIVTFCKQSQKTPEGHRYSGNRGFGSHSRIPFHHLVICRLYHLRQEEKGEAA